MSPYPTGETEFCFIWHPGWKWFWEPIIQSVECGRWVFSPSTGCLKSFRILLAFPDCNGKRKVRGIFSDQGGTRAADTRWMTSVVCTGSFSLIAFFLLSNQPARVSIKTCARTLNLELIPKGAEQAICCNPAIKFCFSWRDSLYWAL